MIKNIFKGLILLFVGHIIYTYYDVNKQIINKVYLIPDAYYTVAPIIQEKINHYIYNIHDDKLYSKDDLNDITTKKQNELIDAYVEEIRKQIIIHAKKGFFQYSWSNKDMIISKNMLSSIVNKLKELFPNIEFKDEYNYIGVSIMVDWLKN
jgi:hypothetical protein